MDALKTRIADILATSGVSYEIITCDPELADTAIFCEHYGYAPEHSANTILVRSKTGPEKYAACLVLATCRLDVNKTVRKKLGARKVSFASADETRAITGMELGGVTAIGLPETVPLWVDAPIMELDYIILGGGGRDTKIIVSPQIFNGLGAIEVVDGLANPIA